MRCSDVVELSVKPRRHVGGILNVNKKRARPENFDSTWLFADCVFRLVYISTQNSLQAYFNLHIALYTYNM